MSGHRHASRQDMPIVLVFTCKYVNNITKLLVLVMAPIVAWHREPGNMPVNLESVSFAVLEQLAF